jgi:hypothetical protein
VRYIILIKKLRMILCVLRLRVELLPQISYQVVLRCVQENLRIRPLEGFTAS